MARRPLSAYTILALLGTWLILIPLVFAEGEFGLGLLPITIPEGVDFLMVQFSAYTGPFLAAILVTSATGEQHGLRNLRRRVLQWRVGGGWYLVAIFTPLAIWLAGFGLALRGEPVTALMDDWSLMLTTFFPLVLIGLILPSLGEETGWRGFALPRLQQQRGPLVGTLILGTIHGTWHIPAFFTAALGPLTATRFITFMVTAVAVTFIYTWLFNNTRASILLAMVLHASSNAASGLLNKLVPEGEKYSGWRHVLVDDGWVTVLTFGAAALALVLATRGSLGYRPPAAR
jgi:membrane protease YdiL (CAAX protease family)